MRVAIVVSTAAAIRLEDQWKAQESKQVAAGSAAASSNSANMDSSQSATAAGNLKSNKMN